MKKGETRVLMVLGFLGLLFLMPPSGDGADLTISNVITGNGNMTLNGAMSATSVSGSGSGLTNLDPTKLSSGTANISISGNAATATTANSVAAGGVVTVGLADGAVTASKLGANAVTPTAIAFYGNVAVVAQSGGDYTNPATAMGAYGSWCGTPSAANPCLLKIMPGVYDIGNSTVVMQPYIDIEGSGQNVTVITGTVVSGSWPPPNGVVNGASHAEIRFLTVKNTGSGLYLAAIVNSSASPAMTNVTATGSGGTNYNHGVFNSSSSSPTMTNVTITASGGTRSYSVYNSSSSSPTMTNVTATASGGTRNYSVYNSSSSPTMTNVTATASGGTDFNCGVCNSNSSPPLTMTNVTVTASGAGTNNYGVSNASSSPAMTNVTATASGAASNYGVYNSSSSSPAMTNVTATGSGAGTNNYGVFNVSSSPAMTNVTATGKDGTNNYGLYHNDGTVLIDRSTFDGSTNSINNGGTVYIGASKLVSAVVGGTGTYHCVGVYTYIASTLTSADGSCDY